MTKKRFNNLTKTLADRIQFKYNGEHINGQILQFYRNREHTLEFMQAKAIENKIEAVKSYAEAWESLKPARDLVGM